MEQLRKDLCDDALNMLALWLVSQEYNPVSCLPQAGCCTASRYTANSAHAASSCTMQASCSCSRSITSATGNRALPSAHTHSFGWHYAVQEDEQLLRTWAEVFKVDPESVMAKMEQAADGKLARPPDR